LFRVTEPSFTPIPAKSRENCHRYKEFPVIDLALRMSAQSTQNLTGLLAAWNEGDEDALKRFVSIVYPEMRAIARRHLGRRELNHSLESAALVNEAYLKLIRAKGIQCENRVHFFALCSQMIRRILVDHARDHRRTKRGGNAVGVPLDEALLGTRARGVEILALDEALRSLSKIDARKSRVVELRFFGGLNVVETAEVLQVSQETVLRDWKMAKSWLLRELAGGPRHES